MIHDQFMPQIGISSYLPSYSRVILVQVYTLRWCYLESKCNSDHLSVVTLCMWLCVEAYRSGLDQNFMVVVIIYWGMQGGISSPLPVYVMSTEVRHVGLIFITLLHCVPLAKPSWSYLLNMCTCIVQALLQSCKLLQWFHFEVLSESLQCLASI